jgi:4-carboxymuconolactone decarboxylase
VTTGKGDMAETAVPATAQAYTESVLYGDLWERPGLSPRDRSLTRALDNALTWEEIGELITHLAFYGGWPVAMSAGRAAARVRAEKTA